jgi:hypothetical protein
MMMIIMIIIIIIIMFLWGKLEGKRELGRRRREWENSVETGVKELDGRQWTGLIWLRIGTRGGLL